jgi:hypothetical protein
LAQVVFQHSLWWIVPVALAAALSVVFLYKHASFSKGQKWLLGSLRFLLLLFLAILLLQPSLKHTFTEEEKPILIWLTDASTSIGEETLKADATAYTQTREALEDTYEVVKERFANGLALGGQLDTQYTDIAQSLQQLQSNYYRQHVAGVVLWTDGIYNRGANPVFQSKTMGFPLHTVGVGDSTVYPDIRIADFNANEEAFLENEFALNVQVEAYALSGKTAVLSLLDADGKQVFQKQLKLEQKQQSFSTEVFLKADAPGLKRYTAKLTTFSEEVNVRNNSSTLSINITNKQKKIALLAGAPHPDIYALKAALTKNERFEVQTFFTASASLKDFDLVVLHEASSAQIKLLGSSNKNYWVFNGPNTNQTDFLKLTQVRGGSQFEPTQAYVNPAFSLFEVPAELMRLSEDAAPVLSPFGKLQAPEGAIPLFYKKLATVNTNEALWYFTNNNQQKSAVTQGVNIWRWRLDEYRQTGDTRGFDELIQSAVSYLSTAAAESRFNVAYKRTYRAGEGITLTATVLNAANALSDKAEVDIALQDENGKRYKYSFSNREKGYILQLGGLEEGIYAFTATAVLGNERFEKKGAFEVRAIEVEQSDLVARFGLLRSMAAQSAGKYYTPAQTATLIRDLASSELAIPKAVIRSETKPLLSYKLLFFILFTLAGLEWVLRKYSGKY